MKRLSVAAAVASTVLATTAVGATVPADAAARHKASTKVAVIGWEVATFDHNFNSDGPIAVANHGTYTETCAQDDEIIGVDANIKGTHVTKHGAYSWKATLNGQTVNSYSEHWRKSGSETDLYSAYDPDNDARSGRLTITFYVKHKKVGTNYVNLSVPTSC